MVYLHAALLLHYAGKRIDEEGIKNVLKAAGVTDFEEGYIKAIVTAIGRVNLSEIIERAKQAPVVAAPMVATPAPTAAPQAPAPAAAEEKKKEEKKEEESLAGLAALFG
ncbi:MAG: 50S ribosomal protein P1 [Crenarchaeota archaeon]|nr:50S ribosomal protein P1 [Thermoproteota archaeon]MCR8453844.1 50S ribosomal protein P1 [Thermoproteota archaeon]MCR8455337.1 50S ribosomal protein P1 [Thermoproteota archaeon]MCR8462607.1 50S ribosomal protein P1 [Thermoproteota archaeon]MCR8472378.1 50S ribosomal protein P1 [Thermoproteota archaeon]